MSKKLSRVCALDVDNNCYRPPAISQNPVGFSSFDILDEESYYFDEANAVDPFLYCAKFGFYAEVPVGLNPYTWEILLQKINLMKK